MTYGVIVFGIRVVPKLCVYVCVLVSIGQVSDVENILGVVYTENINILAEAYDVSLEITFPKGSYYSTSISMFFFIYL